MGNRTTEFPIVTAAEFEVTDHFLVNAAGKAGQMTGQELVNVMNSYIPTGPALLGKIATGYIEVINGVGNTITLKVAANTTIKLSTAVNDGVINLVAGNFDLILGDGNDWLLYCNVAGNLAVVRGNLPVGNNIALARSVNWFGGNIFNLKPLVPTNHYFPQNNEFTYTNPDRVTFIDAADFGVVGDDATSNNDAFSKISLACYFLSQANQPVRVHFKNGTYRLSTSVNFYSNVWLTGQSKTGTVIKSVTPEAPPTVNISMASTITFLDVRVGDSGVGNVFEYDQNVYHSNSANNGFYMVYLGPSESAMNGHYKFHRCDFEYGSIHAGLWLYLARSFQIEACKFNGDAWHNLRITPSILYTLEKAEVIGCEVNGGTTGIFFGSNRDLPIENVLVERNILRNQKEESISFDGFGNNAGLCPVICNGEITSAANDASGRLVIVADMLYHDGVTPNQPSPLSLRNDWTKFKFSFGEGSGQEGVIARIYAFDDVTNELTLDLYTAAADVTIGGDCGVQAGFFNCAVRGNQVYGSVGANNNYATALSIYLNVFGMVIENNFISGCNTGIHLSGGLMLSTYRSLAYNNIVRNNIFVACAQVAGADSFTIYFNSLFGGSPQYGNQCVNNTVESGKVKFVKQQRFLFSENNFNNVALTFSYCGNALPTANASQVGRRFILITDDVNGAPTAITTYVCKLAAAVYSWVEI